MFGSAIVYSGLVIAVVGFILVVKPIPRAGVATRSRAPVIGA
jgi:hypothetical protein